MADAIGKTNLLSYLSNPLDKKNKPEGNAAGFVAYQGTTENPYIQTASGSQPNSVFSC